MSGFDRCLSPRVIDFLGFEGEAEVKGVLW